MEISNEEHSRLRALSEYQILDSGPEPSYEEITTLAASLCQAPLAAISFVDRDRQWTKAGFGCELKARPRDESICNYVVTEKKFLLVENALKDERFMNNPFVTGKIGLRFYAGAPLMSPDGYVLGALCVLDVKPRTLTELQRKCLEVLSNQVVSQMELRKTHLQLRRRSIEEMAASIAHEINNPLAIISGNAAILKGILHSEKVTNQKAFNHLETIEKTVCRIDKIIRALSYDGVNTPFEKIDFRKVIANVVALLMEKFQESQISLTQNLGPLTAFIECYSVQVEQILINLLSNSIDAIFDCEERWIHIDLADEGTHWNLSITDSGKGIAKEVRDKIMQPFFTTKEPNCGTGLGLSISREIAEKHGGNLFLDEIRKNTCFVLSMPKIKSEK